MNDNEQDLALIDRILRGDQFAYRALINRHKAYAFTIAYRIVGSREDAEEISQDAFMNAFRALPSFNREAKFSTWFYRIVFHAALACKRKHKLDIKPMEEVTTLRLGVTEASTTMKHNEQQVYIQKALNYLPSDDVLLITLFYLKELSLEEIESITRIAATTLKVKLFRARKRLAEVLHGLLRQETKSLL